MAAKKKPSATKEYEFPPEIFWISPSREVVPVIGHITGLRQDPDRFGLPAAPESKSDIDDALSTLFEGGCVRGRFESEGFRFQMLKPWTFPLSNAHGFVLTWRIHAREVSVDFYDPAFWRFGKTMSVEEFLEPRFPAAWGLGDVRAFVRRG